MWLPRTWVLVEGYTLVKKERQNERLGENVPRGTVSAPSPNPLPPPLHEQSRRKESDLTTFVNLPRKQQQFPIERERGGAD